MRVYVAGAAAQVGRAGVAMAAVREAGHEVTYDWTADVWEAVRLGLRDTDLGPDQARAIAQRDLAGVRSAEVVLLLEPPAGVGCGCWVELGAALALRAACGTPRVIVSGRGNHLFCRLADAVYATDGGAVGGILGVRGSRKPSDSK